MSEQKSSATAKVNDNEGDEALRTLREHQDKLDAAVAVVADLERAIESQESLKAKALATIAPTDAIERELEEVRANLALRVISQKDAERRELEIEAKLATVTNDAAAGHRAAVLAQRAVEGLTRRLQAARAEVDALESNMQAYVDRLILEKADQEAAAFLDLARKLVVRYYRLIALNALDCYANQGSPKIVGHAGRDMIIPVFNTPSNEGRGLKHSPALFFDWRFAGRERETEAIADMREELIALGVKPEHLPR